jgi:3-hydroxyisobutyrate dehydrogenase-like beta-hydroxyacid dehydrogenase
MKIGFIGLGNLGTPIAENLLSVHKDFFVYNRTFSKTLPFTDKGAAVCSSVKELAQHCDIVFTIVADDTAIKEITLGENGIAMNLRDGGIHASISTILPATAKELEAAHKRTNTHYVGIPVMGRPEAAKSKNLNFLLAGKKEQVEIIRPLLKDAGAATIWDFGEDPGAANVAKLCNNFLIISALEAMAEGITLARKSGIDDAQWMKMLTSTFMNAPIYNIYGNIILNGAYTPPGFRLQLGLKDVNLALEQSKAVDLPMELAQLLQKRMVRCMDAGLGELDWGAITKDVETSKSIV